MFKNILLIVLIISFSSADYLATRDNNQCVYNVQPWQDARGFCYTYSATNIDNCDRRASATDFINGYEYVNNGCYLSVNLQNTSTTQEEWDYLMALLGHALGLTWLISISFLSIIISKV